MSSREPNIHRVYRYYIRGINTTHMVLLPLSLSSSRSVSFSLPASHVSNRPHMTGSSPGYGVGREKKYSFLLFQPQRSLFINRNSARRRSNHRGTAGIQREHYYFPGIADGRFPFYQIITDRECKVFLSPNLRY